MMIMTASRRSCAAVFPRGFRQMSYCLSCGTCAVAPSQAERSNTRAIMVNLCGGQQRSLSALSDAVFIAPKNGMKTGACGLCVCFRVRANFVWVQVFMLHSSHLPPPFFFPPWMSLELAWGKWETIRSKLPLCHCQPHTSGKGSVACSHRALTGS